MQYQVSLQGRSPKSADIQLAFEDAASLKEAKAVARKFYGNPEEALGDAPLKNGEELKSVILLFNNRSYAMLEGLPTDKIRKVWPGKDTVLYSSTLFTFD